MLQPESYAQWERDFYSDREGRLALLELLLSGPSVPWDQVRREFHTLKGQAVALGLDDVIQQLQSAEGLLRRVAGVHDPSLADKAVRLLLHWVQAFRSQCAAKISAESVPQGSRDTRDVRLGPVEFMVRVSNKVYCIGSEHLVRFYSKIPPTYLVGGQRMVLVGSQLLALKHPHEIPSPYVRAVDDTTARTKVGSDPESLQPILAIMQWHGESCALLVDQVWDCPNQNRGLNEFTSHKTPAREIL